MQEHDEILCICQMLRKNIYQLLRDFKKIFHSITREMLCSIVTEFGVPIKLVRLIEMC